MGLLSLPAVVGRTLGRASLSVTGWGVVVVVQVFSPDKLWPWLRGAAALAAAARQRPSAPLARLLRLPLALLQPLSAPSLFFIAAPPLLNLVYPPLVRCASHRLPRRS